MVVELQQPAVTHNQKVWIPEVGTFDSFPLDQCQGAVYKLDSEDLQSLSESLAFAARFESHLVTTAYLDITFGDATFLLEISKNSRPADVAVRYSRDQWTANELRKHQDTRKRIFKTSYHASSLSAQSVEVICNRLKISAKDFPAYVIRVNFKAETATLIVSSVDAKKLPAKSICAFSVLNGEVSLAPVEIGESMSPVSSATSPVNTVAFNRDVNVQLNSDSWKYATYSQSEVDRLLKIRAENITAALSAKISTQQKFVQESVATQEKTWRKMISEVGDQIEQFNTSAVKAADNHNEQMKTLMEKAQNEIEVQFEQVKADLDRTLMNDLKSVDKRLQALEASIQSLSEAKQSSHSQALIILVALSIVLSLANMIVLFVHH
ncbi:hypothetical protein BH10CYA1_BH10CYA1_06490 [soil metagenome]